MICNYIWFLLYEILESDKINTTSFMTIDLKESKALRRKAHYIASTHTEEGGSEANF